MRAIISIFILVCCTLTLSAEATYYYSGSKKIPLYENTSKAIIKTPKGRLNTVNAIPSITPLRNIICDTYDLTVIEKNENVNLNIIKANIPLSASERIVYPCYKNESGEDVIPTSYIYVQLKSDSDFSLLSAMAQKNRCVIIKQNKFMPLWYTLCIGEDTGYDSVELANKMMETKLFANAYPAFEITPMISYDTQALNQWGLYNSEYEDIDISASEAWNYATGRGVTVAVIDTGIDLNHEDLHDNLLPISYDAVSSSSPSAFHNIPRNGSHGTICAGIIGAVRNNGKGIAGVTPDVNLMSVSVEFGSGDIDDQLAEGIIWAYQNGADILSCSWGGRYPSPIIEQAIDSALANGRNGKGCIMVFAAGNGFIGPPVFFPANYNEDVIAVGNIRKSGMWDETSAHGDQLLICAPGTDIFSTLLYDTYGDKDIYLDAHSYDDISNTGTSFSCPHVSGTIALMLELNPDLSISQIREILARTANKVGYLPYSTSKTYGKWNEFYGYGVVDAAKAVKATPHK